MKQASMFALCSVIVLPIFAAEWHVSLKGADTNAGGADAPFRSIQKAAERAQPGDVITVREGIYRERVNPPRGGTSEEKRITYQAAPNERVEITGAEVIKGWEKEKEGIWTVRVPNTFFGKFNPFGELICGDWFGPKKRKHHRGAVYIDGDWLAEAAKLEDVGSTTNRYAQWFALVDKTHTKIWADFKDKDPNQANVEVNVRPCVFYPDKPGRHFITVRGFVLTKGAPNWAPPTAEQMGIIGTHWSKGWLIENNQISYSVCTGVTLGKYGDEFDNTSANSATGYVKTIERAHAVGWNRETVGSHIVRNNHISHCEQAGIVGSLGAVYSKIIGNTIHEIHIRHLFGGAEQAAIKIHASVDMEISQNHVYNSNRAVWLDWMAQGVRVSRNLFHDNWEQDIFVEVNHGPFIFDNNISLSKNSLQNWSQGGAFIHNLMTGSLRIHFAEKRHTPFLKQHGTEVAGLHDNPGGDMRYINNILTPNFKLDVYDRAPLKSVIEGNSMIDGASITFKDGVLTCPPPPEGLRKVALVDTARLGVTAISKLPFTDVQDKEIRLERDYFGAPRTMETLCPGPFAEWKREINLKK